MEFSDEVVAGRLSRPPREDLLRPSRMLSVGIHPQTRGSSRHTQGTPPAKICGAVETCPCGSSSFSSSSRGHCWNSPGNSQRRFEVVTVRNLREEALGHLLENPHRTRQEKMNVASLATRRFGPDVLKACSQILLECF